MLDLLFFLLSLLLDVREFVRLDSIPVLDCDLTFLGPGGDGPVRSDALALPVEFYDVDVLLISFKVLWRHLFGALSERVNIVSSRLVDAV